MPRRIAASRQNEILARASASGSVSVEELADRFEVSRETIRRDLKALAARGLVDVVHGGAITRATGDPPFAERARENAEGKAAIGRLAAGLVEPGMVVLLDSGATTHAIAAALAAIAPKGVTVCATSLRDALTLTRAGLKVVMLGGEIDPGDEATVGPDTLVALSRYRLDLAFVGIGGVTPEGDVTVFSRAAAETRSVMLDMARAGYLVSDHAKFGRAGPARIAWSKPLAGFIVDLAPPRPLAAALAARDIPVLVAGAN